MNTPDMDFIEHVEELRKRLIISMAAFLLLFLLSFIFVQDIYRWLIKDLTLELAVLGPGDILWVYVVLAGILATAGTIPVMAHQVWLFVRPALEPREQKATLVYMPLFFILFAVGLCFGYLVIFPMVYHFLLSLSDGMFMTFFTVERYFRFLINITLPFGFLFELPIIIMFLTSLGILNPNRLKKGRKYAYFFLIVLAVLITPPDFILDILVIIPLLFLYECSIQLSVLVYKRKYNLTN